MAIVLELQLGGGFDKVPIDNLQTPAYLDIRSVTFTPLNEASSR